MCQSCEPQRYLQVLALDGEVWSAPPMQSACAQLEAEEAWKGQETPLTPCPSQQNFSPSEPLQLSDLSTRLGPLAESPRRAREDRWPPTHYRGTGVFHECFQPAVPSGSWSGRRRLLKHMCARACVCARVYIAPVHTSL